MKPQSVQTELFRLITVPVFAACLILALTFSFLQKSQTEQQFKHNQILASELLSYAKFTPTSTHNPFSDAANALLSTGDYLSIVVADYKGEQLASYGLPLHKHSYEKNLGINNEWTHGNNYIYTLPLNAPALQSDNPLWVIVSIDRRGWAISEYQGAITIILAGTLCLFLTFFFARRYKEALSSPLNKIERGVKDFLKGNFERNITIEQTSVFKDLATNINRLGALQKSANDELQLNIDQSTHDLRETLETVEIQNIELDIARKSALQASRVKSEFLANTSHEIRTPLNGILGFSELLRKTELNNLQVDYLTTIEESAKGLLTIINDILDFSRLEIGTLTLEYKPVKIRQLVEDTLKLQTPAANEKNIRMLTIIDHDVPENLQGDPLRLKQVLSNLVSNAIKFTEAGYILLGVSKDQSSENQFTLKFRVTDSGIGLSQDQQERLFDPFTQLDSSESRLHGGTGLGLAIAKGLVDRMNGAIGVESTLGKGATFWFTSTLGRSPSATSKQSYLAGTLRNVHALVYDHSNMGRMEITHYLNGWGAKVCETSVLDEIEPQMNFFSSSEPVDIAIIDSMVDSKTFDRQLVCEHVTQLNHKFNIPVIILAPSSIQRILEPHLADANSLFINRPLFCNKLHQTVCEQLEIVATENIESRPQQHQPEGQAQQEVNILAVDDNPANLKLVTELLKGLNINVTPVESGESAINHVKESQFDLILMDIQMPSMDGIETTGHIRDLENNEKRTPIIALTAHAVSEQKSRLLLAGMDDCLSKPVSESELRHVIERWTNVTIAAKIVSNLGLPTISSTLESQQPTEPAVAPEPSTPPEYNAIVDISLGLSLTNNNPSLAADMLSMLIETLPDTLQKTATYYEGKQLVELQEVVHKLHGGCCYCGVPRLKAISEQTDKNLQKERLNNLANDMKLLTIEINSLLQWAEEHDIESLFGNE